MESKQIKEILNGKSVTMAQIITETTVKPAAKFKGTVIRKTTSANVQLFSNIQSAVYANAVKRSAASFGGNEKTDIENFVQSDTYYTHDSDCYSIVTHKTNGKEYLYCIYNNAKATFEINGEPATQEQVIEFLTPSEAKKLLSNGVTENKTNDIEHDVVVKVVGLENVREIRACGQVIN